MLLPENKQKEIARNFDEPLKYAMEKVKESTPLFSDEQRASLAIISLYKFQKYLSQKITSELGNNATRSERSEYMENNLTAFERQMLYDFRVVVTPRYSKDAPSKQVEFMLGEGPYDCFGLSAVHSSYLNKKYDSSRAEYDYQEPKDSLKMSAGEKEAISFLVEQTCYKLKDYSQISDAMNMWMDFRDIVGNKPKEDRLWLGKEFDQFIASRFEYDRLSVNSSVMNAMDAILENNMQSEHSVFKKILSKDMDVVKIGNIWDN